MKLPIIFKGVYYRGADCHYCRMCGVPIRYEWKIFDSERDISISLCGRHYKQWEMKKELALLDFSDEFRKELDKYNR